MVEFQNMIIEHFNTFEEVNVLGVIHNTDVINSKTVFITSVDEEQDTLIGVINFKLENLGDNLVGFRVAISQLDPSSNELASSLKFSEIQRLN